VVKEEAVRPPRDDIGSESRSAEHRNEHYLYEWKGLLLLGRTTATGIIRFSFFESIHDYAF
jgi:hypothetical protein